MMQLESYFTPLQNNNDYIERLPFHRGDRIHGLWELRESKSNEMLFDWESKIFTKITSNDNPIAAGFTWLAVEINDDDVIFYFGSGLFRDRNKPDKSLNQILQWGHNLWARILLDFAVRNLKTRSPEELLK